MTDSTHPGDEQLSEEDAALLAQALKPQRPEDARAAHMKARILDGIGKSATAGDTAPERSEARTHARTPSAAPSSPVSILTSSAAVSTVRVQDRQWRQVSRGVEMCILHEDQHSRSILLRMQPDSFLLPHRHAMSEESILLEGDAIIGDDLRLAAGDYHYSPSGALHPLLQSPGGCIVYVRGEKGFRPRVTTGLFRRLLRGLTARPSTDSNHQS